MSPLISFHFDGIGPFELNVLVDEMERALRASGLRAGQILACRLPASVRFIAALFASIRIGAIFCPLNLRLPEQAIEEQLSLLRPKILLLESEIKTYTATVTPLLGSSFLIFTSGSSGSPKIANLSLQNFLAAASSANEVCKFSSADTWLLSLPLYHVGGLAILFRALLARGSVVTDPANAAITHLSYVPTQLYRSWPIYPRLKAIVLSGAPIHQIPAQLPIIPAYGMTETASMVVGQQGSQFRDGLTFLGFPHKGKKMTLNREGEILIQGDSLFQGYWDGVNLQTQSEWFATGDLGRFDPLYGFAIVGRKDNQFTSGGENIQPEEIEKMLLDYPSIMEAIVAPKADREYGYRPFAFIRTAEQIDKKKLREYLLKRLPKYKIPCDFFSLDGLDELGFKLSRKKIFDFLASK